MARLPSSCLHLFAWLVGHADAWEWRKHPKWRCRCWG
jgi:hypothetical protein